MVRVLAEPDHEPVVTAGTPMVHQIGCDAVSFCELDLLHHNTLTFQGTDGEFIEIDMNDADDPYWEVSRGFLPCEYHEKGDHLTPFVKCAQPPRTYLFPQVSGL